MQTKIWDSKLANILHEADVEHAAKMELFRRYFAKCESPIEQQLFVQWVECFGVEALYPGLSLADWETEGLAARWERANLELLLIPQHTLTLQQRSMRIDFLVEVNGTITSWPPHPKHIAVELDGHDFHERTPDQALRDRSKDRLLVQHGYTVLRFTGREIFHSPLTAITEIQQTAKRLLA